MSFQERFKGKITLMTKNGPNELLSQVQTSIPKYTEPAISSKIPSKPMKLPLQTYNPKYPPTSSEKPKPPSLSTNPFLIQNPYPTPNPREDGENQHSHGDLNNFQAHYLKGSPSIKTPIRSSKDILLSNSRNIVNESTHDSNKPVHDSDQHRQPSLDRGIQMNRKSNTANGAIDIGSDLKYKPYTYKDYAEIQKTANSTLQRGLGPNINTEDWLIKKEKIDKMNNFSQYVKLFNSKKISDEPRLVDRDFDEKINSNLKSKREKAMDFAKNIPKPMIIAPKRKKEEDTTNTNKQEFKDELELLEHQHLKLLNEIESLNNNNGKQQGKKK